MQRRVKLKGRIDSKVLTGILIDEGTRRGYCTTISKTSIYGYSFLDNEVAIEDHTSVSVTLSNMLKFLTVIFYEGDSIGDFEIRTRNLSSFNKKVEPYLDSVRTRLADYTEASK